MAFFSGDAMRKDGMICWVCCIGGGTEIGDAALTGEGTFMGVMDFLGDLDNRLDAPFLFFSNNFCLVLSFAFFPIAFAFWADFTFDKPAFLVMVGGWDGWMERRMSVERCDFVFPIYSQTGKRLYFYFYKARFNGQ